MPIIDYRQVAQQNKRKQILPLVLLSALVLGIAYLGWVSYSKISNWSKGINFSEVIKSFELSDQLQPVAGNQSLAGQHNSQGVKYLQAENYPKAKAEFEQAIQLDPNNYKSYHNLGIASASVDDWPYAIQAYQKALALNPDYEPSEVNLIGAYKGAGNCAQSKDEAILFLDQNSNSSYERTVRWLLADAHLCLFEYSDALSQLKAVLSLQSDSEDNYRVYHDMAVAYCALDQIQAGLDFGLKSISIIETQTSTGLNQEQQALPYLTMGNCYHRTGQDDATAVIYYKKALELNPALADLYQDLFVDLEIITK